MSNQSVVINLPEDIYSKYKQRAEQNSVSVEAEITESLLKDAPTGGKPETALDMLLAQLAFFDDIALQRLAESLYPKNEAARLVHLHSKQAVGGLDETETNELAELVKKSAQWFIFWLVSRNEALNRVLERNQSIL